LAAAFGLEGPLGYIIDHAIASDVVQRVRFAHIFRPRADDDAKLDLPIGLLRSARDFDIVIRADDG